MKTRIGFIQKAFVLSRHTNMKAVPLIVGVALLMCLLDSVQGQLNSTLTTKATTAASSTAGAGPVVSASGSAAPGSGSGSGTPTANGTQGGNSGSQRISFTPFSVFIIAAFFAIANIALA